MSTRDAPAPPDQLVVLRVYRDVDRAAARELRRLRDREGVTPSCRRGCAHCCEQEIPATLLEARAVAGYIQRTFSPAQRAALRGRMVAWFRWLRRQLPALLDRGAERRAAIFEHGPSCVLLERGACVYPVRPTICRTHFVRSDPRSCMPRTRPEALPQPPAALASVHERAGPHARQLREFIERLGLRFEDAVSSVPRWLAVELGWPELLHPDAEPEKPHADAT